MFTLLPWRWTHWLVLLVGSLFLATYVKLLSWGPVVQAIQRLGDQPATPDVFLVRAEAVFGLVTLLILTPFVGFVGLFLLLLVWVGVAGTFGPLVRKLGLPDWAFTLVLAAVSAGAVYGRSGVWLPWVMSALNRIATAFLIPLL